MTTLLSTQALQLETSHALLFQDISFTLQTGNRIGLIGHNGSGKSTLLSLLAGQREASSGTIQVARHCRLQFVEQHLPEALSGLSLSEALLDAIDGAADRQWQVDSLLTELEIDAVTANVPVRSLSGGQHTRLLLGRAVLRDPNLLLLDEPGNHLDLPSLLWLEAFLLRWKGAFVLVSHDQRLLDKVTQQSWILRDRTLHCFEQPCSAALQSLHDADQAALARRQAEQGEIDRIAASSKRLAIWGRTYDNEDLARKAKVMQKRADRLKQEQTVVTEGVPWRLHLRGQSSAANQLLRMAQLPVRAAPDLDVLFQVDQFAVRPGDKIALLGANGTGKSSLLRMCWQAMEARADADNAMQGIRFHPTVDIGYYDQSLQQLDSHASLTDALYPFVAHLEQARTALARRQALISAGFPYHRHQQIVASLSGGERARLLFLALSLASYHLLLLDEPTNHLDLQGKRELALSLAEFEGGFLMVSHDRDLIEQSCREFWLVRDGRLEKWLDAESAYQRLWDGRANQKTLTPMHALGECRDSETSSDVIVEQNIMEQNLQRLCDLEALLDADLARKPRHQKPQQQALWQQEIRQLYAELKLD
ncbi:MAG: ABC-F family ATP-binding cassette domain-containing protein [Burkholderiales bacterium]|nr:ABC-F family ATP-binding cassette domain-containing protein [Burkholderiales bacterium]